MNFPTFTGLNEAAHFQIQTFKFSGNQPLGLTEEWQLPWHMVQKTTTELVEKAKEVAAKIKVS